MYTVTIETIKKGKSKVQKFVLGEIDSDMYDQSLGELSDVLFDLDLEFDEINGDGDMVIDDILISISEEEIFEHKLGGRRGTTYVVKGFEA